MRVASLMTTNVVCVGVHQSLNEAAHLMWQHDCGSLPVTNGEEKVVAMITDRDISIASYFQGKPLREIPVSSAMSKQLFHCRASDDAAHVQQLMQAHKIRRVPVLDAKFRAVGIITLNDLARASTKRSITATGIRDTLASIGTPPTVRSLMVVA
ncbi:MAG: CBS domain-containing protein [Pseudomonadales bacterium]|nr:CBS domain-containing protein [Pseudomonadales bacterium]